MRTAVCSVILNYTSCKVEFIENSNTQTGLKELFISRECILLLQRGSDELLSQSGAVSNGASMSPQPHHAADNNNDAKKVSAFFN